MKTKERESNHVTNCKGCVETSSTDFLLTKWLVFSMLYPSQPYPKGKFKLKICVHWIGTWLMQNSLPYFEALMPHWAFLISTPPSTSPRVDQKKTQAKNEMNKIMQARRVFAFMQFFLPREILCVIHSKDVHANLGKLFDECPAWLPLTATRIRSNWNKFCLANRILELCFCSGRHGLLLMNLSAG